MLQTMLLGALVNAELHPTDLAVLKDLHNSLRDMPGSSFFSTWKFQLDPCHFFTGVVCDSIQGWTRVTALNLGTGYAGAPGLAGELSPSLGSLEFLKQLTIAPGTVAGGIPSSLGQLSQLQFLGISQNRLSGPIPESFGSLINLQFLDLSKNMLTGSIPKVLGALPSLIAVTISENSLSGSMPSFSGRIAHLDLGRNGLSGSLPPLSLSLQYLSLQRNNLGGGLSSLVLLQSLTYVDLSFNQFTGSVPKEVLQIKLSALHLQRNRLSGTISPNGPVQIKTIDLSYNRFSGGLSPFLATAQILYLNNNHLSGTVPLRFLDSLLSANLQILYLQHNYLTGFEVHSDVSLPTPSSLCIQYNCMVPPTQSACPLKSGRQVSRPSYQCIHS
ncbi:hypothetical protein O6H91_Y038700 [Diphasiastrum complanatum]|nr:hypothetical protein O6H91_Y038700 [Diphasiastrum complanatum]